MNRTFISNILLLIGINFLIKPLYLFGVDAHIQNLVGTNTYGIYFDLLSFVFLFQFINDPGIQSFNSKNIAQNPENLNHHFPRIMAIKGVLGLGFILAIFISASLMGYERSLYPLLFILAINQFLSVLFLYIRSNIAAIGKYRIDSFLSALDKVLMLLILGYLSWLSPWKDDFQIIWLAYGQLVALLIACLVAIGILLPNLKGTKFIFSTDYMRKLLKWSLPFALVLMLMSIYTKMDGVMLGRMLNDNGMQAGIYAQSYRILDAVNMVGYLFAALLLPMYATLIGKKESPLSLSITGLRMMIALSTIIAVTIISFRNELMDWLYIDASTAYGSILMYLMLSFVAIAISYTYGSLIAAGGKLKKLNILFALGVLINFGLNYYLIPEKGAEGAAIATVITQYFVMIGQMYLAHSAFSLAPSIKLLARAGSFILSSIVISILFRNYIDVQWILAFVLLAGLLLLMAILFRILDKNMLTELISAKEK